MVAMTPWVAPWEMMKLLLILLLRLPRPGAEVPVPRVVVVAAADDTVPPDPSLAAAEGYTDAVLLPQQVIVFPPAWSSWSSLVERLPLLCHCG
jgi:hypothetical protein